MLLALLLFTQATALRPTGRVNAALPRPDNNAPNKKRGLFNFAPPLLWSKWQTMQSNRVQLQVRYSVGGGPRGRPPDGHASRRRRGVEAGSR